MGTGRYRGRVGYVESLRRLHGSDFLTVQIQCLICRKLVFEFHAEGWAKESKDCGSMLPNNAIELY